MESVIGDKEMGPRRQGVMKMLAESTGSIPTTSTRAYAVDMAWDCKLFGFRRPSLSRPMTNISFTPNSSASRRTEFWVGCHP